MYCGRIQPGRRDVDGGKFRNLCRGRTQNGRWRCFRTEQADVPVAVGRQFGNQSVDRTLQGMVGRGIPIALTISLSTYKYTKSSLELV